MTFREKLMMEHPDLVDHDGSKEDWNFGGGCAGCPDDFGYETKRCYSDHCLETDCAECWNRVIPGTEETQNNNNKGEKNMNKNKNELLEEIAELQKQVANLERYKQYAECADEMKAMHTAFMNSGFTNEQAFEMLKTMLPLAAAMGR